jgi:hypothetical protein
MRLKRSECSVLTLVLKGKWYDRIASGEKKEEYREYKDFWIKRVEHWQNRRVCPGPLFLKEDKIDVIAFSRGYCKPDLFFVCDKILIRERLPLHPEWGEPNIKHFVLGLGEKVSFCD